MTTVTRQNRLYGMMQFLMTAAAQRAEPMKSAPRGIVSEQDALTAVLGLAAAIDEPAQAGRLPRNQAEHMAEMLMVIREFIKPLPPGVAEEGGPDLVNADLTDAVGEIRAASAQAGFHG